MNSLAILMEIFEYIFFQALWVYQFLPKDLIFMQWKNLNFDEILSNFDHDLVYTTHFVAAENIISYLFQEQSTYYIQVPVFYLNFICIFKYGMCNYFFDEFLNWAHMKSIT